MYILYYCHEHKIIYASNNTNILCFNINDKYTSHLPDNKLIIIAKFDILNDRISNFTYINKIYHKYNFNIYDNNEIIGNITIDPEIKINNKYNLYLEDNEGNGNCFFYCVCKMLNKENIMLNSNDLRSIVRSSIEDMSYDDFLIHKAIYESDDYNLKIQNKEKLCEIAMNSNYDADSMAINIIGNKFKCKFIIYMEQSEQFIQQGYTNDDYEFILCLYYTGNHYMNISIKLGNELILNYTRKQNLTHSCIELLNTIL